MQLAGWVRDRVWRADSWCAALAQLRKELAAEPRSAGTIARTWDLAVASEYLDPDRGRALALYLDAWRAGHPEAAARTKPLARELRAHVTIAELAMGEGDLLAAGRAFVDAGLLDLAVAPLAKIADPALALDAKPLLAIARRERHDPEREIAACLARAKQSPTDGAALYVQAARLARCAGGDPNLHLLAAARHYADDPDVDAAVEEHLLERGNADELLEHYRRRFEAAQGERAYVARMLAAACRLVVHNVHLGLGLRLLRRSLEHAYQAMLPEIPQHLAAWELLLANARLSRTTTDLIPLVVAAVGAPLSEDDAIFVARAGLEITWRDAGDIDAAHPYATALIDFVPDHPLALAFAAAHGEAAPIPMPVPMPMPVPLPMPSAPAPAPAPAPPRAPSGRAALLASSAPLRALRQTARDLVAPPAIGAPRAPRAVVPVDVMIELPTGAFFTTVLRDLSTSGAFVVTKRALDVGTVLALELHMPNPDPLQQSRHRVNATIARRTELGCGLAFVDPPAALVAAISALTT